MKKHNYKKLEIYQRSLKLACELMPICDSIRPYRLSEQIAGSCISIPSNIAEGSCRSSDADFLRFLEYSSGSCAELETQLIILQSQKKAHLNEIKIWLKEIDSIFSMINGFIYMHSKN